MTIVKIKYSNYQSIKNFLINGSGNDNNIYGTKLKALFKLIETKGEPIETNEKKLQGLKALPINEGEFIAIKRIPVNGSFYPCVLHTYLLTTL